MEATLDGPTQTLSDGAFERIQAAIVKGEIAPGTRISEQYLSTTFGIGRGPLREAIRRLEGRRLVVRIPHAGVRVVSLDYAELIELYHVREALEGMACRLAAQNMTEDEIAALRDVLAMHEQHSGLKANKSYYQQEPHPESHALRRALSAGAHVPLSLFYYPQTAEAGLCRTPQYYSGHRRPRW